MCGNFYSDAEDLSVYTPSANIHQGETESGSVTVDTGGITVHGVGVIGINLDNPPDESDY